MEVAESTIRLFHETVTCGVCGYVWTGYLHGFSRGHAVLVRDGAIACVPDDLAYEFANQILAPQSSPDQWVGDPANTVRSHGWRNLETCPNCGLTDFVAQYDQASLVDVPYIHFGVGDFILCGTTWSLSLSGQTKANGT